MKAGFIIEIKNDYAKIRHKYGEDAEFKASEYSEIFEVGDIVIFRFNVFKSKVFAIDVKLVSGETSFCRENKSSFHSSQWNLILKGNSELLLEHYQNIILRDEEEKKLRLNKYCNYLYPKLLELLEFCEFEISRWSNYKIGERYDSGLNSHNIFNIPKQSKIIEELTTDVFLCKAVHFINDSKNQFYPCSNFIVKSEGKHIGRFQFTSNIEKLFLSNKKIDIDEDRFNNEKSYNKDIISKVKKNHSDFIKNLASEISMDSVFNMLYSTENKKIEEEIFNINYQIHDWKYLDFFPEKKTVFGKYRIDN